MSFVLYECKTLLPIHSDAHNLSAVEATRCCIVCDKDANDNWEHMANYASILTLMLLHFFSVQSNYLHFSGCEVAMTYKMTGLPKGFTQRLT